MLILLRAMVHIWLSKTLCILKFGSSQLAYVSFVLILIVLGVVHLKIQRVLWVQSSTCFGNKYLGTCLNVTFIYLLPIHWIFSLLCINCKHLWNGQALEILIVSHGLFELRLWGLETTSFVLVYLIDVNFKISQNLRIIHSRLVIDVRLHRLLRGNNTLQNLWSGYCCIMHSWDILISIYDVASVQVRGAVYLQNIRQSCRHWLWVNVSWHLWKCFLFHRWCVLLSESLLVFGSIWERLRLILYTELPRCIKPSATANHAGCILIHSELSLIQKVGAKVTIACLYSIFKGREIVCNTYCILFYHSFLIEWSSLLGLKFYIVLFVKLA